MTYQVNVKNIAIKHKHETHFDDGKITKWLESDTETIEGIGLFETPFSKPNNDEYDGVSVASVSIRNADEDNKERNYNLTIHISPIDSYSEKFKEVNLIFYLDEKSINRIKKIATDDDCELTVNFDIVEWIETESHYGETAKALITRIDNSKKISNKKEVIDYQIKDIKNYLIRKNCLNSNYGQVAEICTEFAESFRNVPVSVNWNDLLDEINSLLASYRYTFHRLLNDEDDKKIKHLNETYNFVLNSYSENIEAEFEKITVNKEKYDAIKIYNHLWYSKKAEDIFRNGYAISSTEAESLADEYLNLKYVKSKLIEKINIDLLLSTTIADKANSLQYHKQISAKTLLSIVMGFYNKDNNSKFTDIKIKDVFFLTAFFVSINLILKIVFGLFEWWLSGLIAGDNETARIVLFGTLFAADSILMYLYQRSDDKNFLTDVPNKVDEKNFYIFLDMCNLHKMIDVYKSNSFKELLHKIVKEGTIFPNSLHKIIERSD